MDKKNKSDKEKKLDELQAAWVLGKQRGESVPLKKSELADLLRAERILWNVLNGREREVLGGLQDKFVGQESAESKKGMSLKEKVRVARTMTGVLFDLIERDFRGVLKNMGWGKMKKLEKDAVKEELFRFKYGSYRDFFSYELVAGIWGR